MFSSHVNKQLSAFCNGETSADESRKISDHLSRCERCRSEYEEIKLGAELASQLSLVTAPDEIWSDIQQLLSDDRRGANGGARRFGWGQYRLGVGLAAAILIILIAGVGWLRSNRPATDESSRVAENGPDAPKKQQPRTGPSWQVEATGGAAVKVGSENITDTGVIGVGEALETGSNSTARINVGEIGQVDVEPNTRIRLLDARTTEHRLALDVGTMHAKVIAPPRMFFVDTPSAEAVDLGCAYTLQVDDQGRSFLHVTSGWVSLVRQGIESFVPLGAMCQTRPGIGPGTPYFEDASREFIDALESYDFGGGGAGALTVVLNQSRDRDTLTLWHLLRRVSPDERPAVVERIAALVRLPKGVTRRGLINLDERMMDLELWEEAMDTIWF